MVIKIIYNIWFVNLYYAKIADINTTNVFLETLSYSFNHISTILKFIKLKSLK